MNLFRGKLSFVGEVFLVLTILLLATTILGSGASKKKITFASWRTEDSEEMHRINSVFEEKHPNIDVKFKPIKNTEYDAWLFSSIKAGKVPDLVFLRPFSFGLEIFNRGVLLELNDKVPAVKEFPKSAKGAWMTEDGTIFGVPILGVTHGVYYNKKIFDKYRLEEPTTWQEFMDVAQTLKENGEIVFAQGSKPKWTLEEIIFDGLGANFFGGEKTRQKLIAGEVSFTNQRFVNAFEHLAQLQKYFPEGYQGIGYTDMQQMFKTGMAAMFIGGSWELGTVFGETPFEIGWFPPPVENEGDTIQYCFQIDSAIGVNKNSENLEAAIEYAKWTATTEFAKLVNKELAGFFPFTPGKFEITNPLAKEMINVSKTADNTVRLPDEKLNSGTPSASTLIQDAMQKMYTNKKFTPKDAAEYVQKGLEKWYEPLQD